MQAADIHTSARAFSLMVLPELPREGTPPRDINVGNPYGSITSSTPRRGQSGLVATGRDMPGTDAAWNAIPHSSTGWVGAFRHGDDGMPAAAGGPAFRWRTPASRSPRDARERRLALADLRRVATESSQTDSRLRGIIGLCGAIGKCRVWGLGRPRKERHHWPRHGAAVNA